MSFARLPGPFQVVGLTISPNPASVAGIACGNTILVTYFATISIASDSNAGAVQLVWDVAGFRPSTTVTFAPAQTVQNISYPGKPFSVKLGRFTKFPNATIASTSPNAVTSASAQPGGVCS